MRFWWYGTLGFEVKRPAVAQRWLRGSGVPEACIAAARELAASSALAIREVGDHVAESPQHQRVMFAPTQYVEYSVRY